MSMAPWLSVTFSLRRFALFAIALCFASSLLILTSSNLAMLYAFRLLQGLSGGLTIPLLMVTALRALPPPIRLYGLAAYALTATFFPALSTGRGGVVGGRAGLAVRVPAGRAAVRHQLGAGLVRHAQGPAAVRALPQAGLARRASDRDRLRRPDHLPAAG